jgi:DNA uptake protein ComE-like DNA-binding protein
MKTVSVDRSLACRLSLVVMFGLVCAVGLSAQTAAPAMQPILDANTATEAQLLKAPHMNAAVVKAVVAGRPYKSIVDLNKVLLAQKLTAEQARAFYADVFIPINLNTATDEEILLIPGMGKRMLHEFKEYRPWKTTAQFDKEIGKYVDQKEVKRLARYVRIP